MNPICKHQIIFVTIIAIAAAIALSAETGLIPAGMLTPQADEAYVLSIISVALTLCGVYAMLRLMAVSKVEHEILHSPQAAYLKWSGVRMGILAVVLCGNTIIYYTTAFNKSAGWCALIALAASFFAWPSAKELEQLKEKTLASKQ